MKEVYCLTHIIDPFGVQDPALIMRDPRGGMSNVSLEDLESFADPVVTFEVPKLLLALRRSGFLPPKQLIEIRDGLKLAAGLSKDQCGEKNWDTLKALAAAKPGRYAKKIADLLHGRSLQPAKAEVDALLQQSSVALEICWQKLKNILIERGEWRRFEEVEIPVQQVFWYRQIKGIGLDKKQWIEAKESVKKDKYIAYRELAKMLGMSPSSLTFKNISKHLSDTDAAFLKDYENSAYMQGCFELAQDRSNFARSFVAFSRSRKDETTLIRVGSGEARIYPLIECFGTVTGRIIVSDPALQALRRKYRGIIDADAGCSLLYCDYSQFEPGILASIAGDSALLDAYNSNDLYSELSVHMFGDISKRKEAKRVFLAYMYGMSSGAIAGLLVGRTTSDKETSTYKSQIDAFFSRFAGLSKVRLEALAELQETGRVGSLMGNFRIRTSSGRLTKKEQHWALSQRIQGTASLIFKEVIREVAEKFGPESILLPMHDALLLQAKPSLLQTVERGTVEIMQSVFRKWCPNVHARVVVGPFSQKHISP